MYFESNMIIEIGIRRLEVRAVQCSSFDDFDSFVRKFEMSSTSLVMQNYHISSTYHGSFRSSDPTPGKVVEITTASTRNIEMTTTLSVLM